MAYNVCAFVSPLPAAPDARRSIAYAPFKPLPELKLRTKEDRTCQLKK